MSAFKFLLEGLRDIRTVGTISRSSQFVSKKMLENVDFKNAKCIVELGAGDGPITKYILKNMTPQCKLLAFEVNHSLCETLAKKLPDTRMRIVEDSAEYIEKYLKEEGFEKADYIISALPFVSLPEKLGDKILVESQKNLKKGGKFVQLNYSLLALKRYEKVFGKPSIGFVPLNLPPAFVFVCG